MAIDSPPTGRARAAARATVAAVVLATGCYESDNATFHRAWERERRTRVAGMRAATKQHARGRDLAGDALRTFLADTTHESVFERAPSGQPMRYVERGYFAPDGRFVYMNSLWALDPAGRDGSRWWVDGSRLCIVNLHMSQDAACYTVAVRDDGRPQYFVDAPGEDAHGLLTKIPTTVHRGRLAPP